MVKEPEIEELLKDFPFSNKNRDRQLKVLSQYIIESPGLNKSELAERLNINRGTVTKIEETWEDLHQEEKAALTDYLRQKYLEVANLPADAASYQEA
ncbi:winged helix-turn-helix transcriptional regulator [Haloarcula litorea]|uniref:winged helix-turn-helix transcriptional regulator n=1 Tax=Haloarcula litorea TaxID=3032579 RepID=UPI0023E8585B|nr:winged helix-turn-helix transcriptional regulator [Halomicroarcula sp. GDY20]